MAWILLLTSCWGNALYSFKSHYFDLDMCMNTFHRHLKFARPSFSFSTNILYRILCLCYRQRLFVPHSVIFAEYIYFHNARHNCAELPITCSGRAWDRDPLASWNRGREPSPSWQSLVSSFIFRENAELYSPLPCHELRWLSSPLFTRILFPQSFFIRIIVKLSF